MLHTRILKKLPNIEFFKLHMLDFKLTMIELWKKNMYFIGLVRFFFVVFLDQNFIFLVSLLFECDLIKISLIYFSVKFNK